MPACFASGHFYCLKETAMSIFIAFLTGFICKTLLNYLFSISFYVKLMKDLEIRFLMMSTNLIQWKEHALQILDLTYQKASEQDPEQKESFKIFRNKVDEKYNQACELFVVHIKSILRIKQNIILGGRR